MNFSIQYSVLNIKRELNGLYPETEISAFIRIILEEVLNTSMLEYYKSPNNAVTQEQAKRIKETTLLLKKFTPIQYIFNKQIFADIALYVDSNVLIPRPETEELLNWILEDNRHYAPHILDIGTGSGCLAIALKKNIKDATVTAMDIRPLALAVAQRNSQSQQQFIDFKQDDILQPTGEYKNYNIIVSNPPYVCNNERKLMHDNVLRYEPESALFVPDNDPLLFYKAIAIFAQKHLLPKGHLYVEINEQFGNETASLFEQHGFERVTLQKDIHGRDRMIRAQKSIEIS